MDKDSVSKKHHLFFVGGARGVERFYLINRLLQLKPHAKVIHTGGLLQSVIKDLKLKDLDNVSLKEYHQFVEPTALKVILAHLEHSDVILDTHFHYRIPAMSAYNLLQLKDSIAGASVIIVSETPERIYDRMKRTNDWFAKLENIREDVMLNDAYFDIYGNLLSKFVPVKSVKVDANELETVDTTRMV